MSGHVLYPTEPCPDMKSPCTSGYGRSSFCLSCLGDGTRAVLGAVPVRLEPARECFVYVGEDIDVDGVPFGSAQKTGDEYRSNGGPVWEGDVPMWREKT